MSWNDTDRDIDTISVYTATNECCVDIIWSYSICYDHTEYFVRRYSSFSSWPRSEYVLNTTGPERPELGNTEAILLVSLAHTNLKIQGKIIPYDTAIIIIDFLKSNKLLKKLKLSQNSIAFKSIKQIMKAIQTNSTLQILDISSNNISYKGIVAISECLTINNALQELSLSWNSTTTEGITKIAEAIAVNTGLHTLDLSSQHIKHPVFFTMTLLTAMKHNHTMIRLVLPTSVITNETITMIENRLDKINEERIKKGTNTFVLDPDDHSI